jgi:hypothetical protein
MGASPGCPSVLTDGPGHHVFVNVVSAEIPASVIHQRLTMSTIHPNPQTTIRMPASIRQLLGTVRRRFRRDACLTGCLWVICCMAAVFWITTAADLSWFAVQRLELPAGLRSILLAVLLPCLGWILLTRILYPLVRRVRDLDVAVLLERRFPQFQDRLITSVESAAGYPSDDPLVAGMLQRAAHEADHLAASVAAADVFDPRPLKRLILMAGLLSASVAAFAISSPGALQRWWNAFVRCDTHYHLRSTDLQVHVVAQPGDRRVRFQQTGSQPLYLHPRGADLEMEIVVPEGGPATGGTWVVPDRVRVDVSRSDQSLSRSYVSPTSGRTFRFVITRLQEPIEIELLGGDFRTPTAYRVEPVNPPSLDSVVLNCRYPDYTGWNELREAQVPVTGSEVSLPLGTEFVLEATSAKLLQSARIVSDWFEVAGDRELTRVIPRQGLSITMPPAGPLISPDGTKVTARFRLVATAPADNATSEPATTSPDSGTTSPEASRAASHSDSESLPVPPNTSLRFFLHDMDNVMSISPEVLRIQGIPDRPPVIAARGTGIDNAVTRLARIPVTGRVTDDYGIAAAGFQFLVDDESSWRPRPFHRPPTPAVTEYDLQRDQGQDFELFEVQPLELTEGQTLTLAISAADGNTLTGPGISRSEPMVFRIVSNEDLLSLLYTREITLRRRLEEVISQLQQIRDDLQFHQEVAQRVDSDDASRIRPEDRTALSTCATRSGNSLRRQANELSSVAEGFDDIVRQLINNAIPPQQLAENMRNDILTPLQQLTDQLLPEADRVLSEFRVKALASQKSEALVRAATQQVEVVITRLNQILESVRDLAEFHEALRDLKAILEDQQRLTDEIKALQKRNLIDKLKLLE